MENINDQIVDIYTRLHAVESAVGLTELVGGAKKSSKKGDGNQEYLMLLKHA